jgi:hypothetical protein
MSRRMCAAGLAAVVVCALPLAAEQPAVDTAGRGVFFVTPPGADLVTAQVARPAPPDPTTDGYQTVPAPGIRNVQNEAMATSVPWVDSNGWRFAAGLTKAHYGTLPAGSAPLAAAEAFTFDVAAVLNPAPADLAELGRIIRFLAAQVAAPMPARANVGVLSSDSPLFPEVLNMLTRRNLLYRVVTAPDPTLDLAVQLGTDQFPMTAARDPSAFAARVREALGDDRRLVRIYGANTVIARLLGTETRGRLVLLNYSRTRNQYTAQDVRVRVRGRVQPVSVAAYGALTGAQLEDVALQPDAVEFTLPNFTTIAIVDLEGRR